MAQFLPMIATTAAGAGGAAAAGGTAAGATGAAAAGGGLFTLKNVALAGSLLGTVGGAASQYQAGVAAKEDSEVQAEMEGIKAREDAIGRRERLIRTWAQQNARVGAAGIADTGSPTQVMLQDVSEFEREDAAKKSISEMRQDRLKMSGSNAKKAGKIGAGVSLLKGAADAYTVFGK